MLRQIQNYLQYFDWQWANGLAYTERVFAGVRIPFTLLFISLGMYGAAVLRARDRSVFWLLVLLFLTTGPLLVGYMNFRPGNSLAWDLYPQFEMHEVRERDYFFVVSFQVWGLFAGIGVAAIYWWLRANIRFSGPILPASVLGLALIPLVLNFSAASRAHGPDVTLANDFAYNLLQSTEPYSIIFTNGDNDTFPLWYLQEVEGVRQDVSVVNLSLGNTDWYIRQLRDNPVRPFAPEQAPWFAHLAPESPPGPLHSWTDAEIEQLRPVVLPQALTFRAGQITTTYPDNSVLHIHDVLILRLIQETWDRRPSYFGMTSGTGAWARLSSYVTQEGLAFRVHTTGWPDSSRLAPGLFGVPMDVPRTDSLTWQVFRYADLFSGDSLAVDPTSRNIIINLSYPFLGLAQAYELLGDRENSLKNFQRAFRLQPVPQLAQLIDAVTDTVPPVMPADTPAGN